MLEELGFHGICEFLVEEMCTIIRMERQRSIEVSDHNTPNYVLPQLRFALLEVHVQVLRNTTEIN